MQTINIRQLQHNMKDVATKVQQGESFAVFRNSDLIFQINPATTIELPRKKQGKEKTTLHDIFKNMQSTSKYKNTSQEVDTIVYKN